MAEPERGAMDADEEKTATPGFLDGYKVLLRNRGYVLGCLGYAAVTFAVGALVFWAPEWLKTDKNISAEKANLILGACVVGGGLIGTLVGGAIGDRLIRRGVRGAYFWVCGGGAILAAPFCLAMLMTTNMYVYAGSIFAGVTLVLSGNGPVNALLVNMVPSNVRTTALGFAVVTIHLLGDGLSVTLVGMISTSIHNSGAAMPSVVTALGHLFRIDPGTQPLSIALLVMPVALIAGGLLYFAGARTTEGQLT